MNHEEARDLLAVHALDAVPRDQKAALDAHVSTCEECARTLAEHRETAGLLAQIDEPEPSRQWDRIAAAIESSEEAPAEVVPLARPRGVPVRLLVAVGGAAAAVAAAITFAVVEGGENGGGGIEAAAREAADDPDAHRVELEAVDGNAVGDAIVLPDGQAYLLESAFPVLEEGETYQLWALDRDGSISVGLLGRDPETRQFAVPEDARQLAVTVEPATGSIQPTGRRVADASL